MTALVQGSHCHRVLKALEDGDWHTTRELYRECGPMILHSRISDLRKRGHQIAHEHIPGKSGAEGSRYRLLDGHTPAGPDRVPLEEAVPSSPASSPSPPKAGPVYLPLPAQPALFEIL